MHLRPSLEAKRAPAAAYKAWIGRLVRLAAGPAALVFAALPGAPASAQPPPAVIPGTFDYPQTENVTTQPNISGIWQIENYIFSARPQAERAMHQLDGSPPPLLPAAAALYKKRMDDSDAGHPFAAAVAYCLPGGMPAMMLGAPYPFQVIQSPGQVTTVHEENHLFRIIYLNGKHPDDDDLTFMGHSIGHWEADTLVVDTVGLTDETTMDFNGMPHSDQLHIVEHIRRTGPRQLEDVLTFDDPKTFSHSWSTRRTYRLLSSGDRLREYVCENQRNSPSGSVSGFDNPH